MVFNDKSNFDGCLSAINKDRPLDKKRFWKIETYHKFFAHKASAFLGLEEEDDNCLIRAYIYTGKYTAKLIESVKKQMGRKIREYDELISKFTSFEKDPKLKDKVGHLKESFQREKKFAIEVIQKQERNSVGQKSLFKFINEKMPFTQIRTTDLKQAQGRVYQKGVDVQLATDLIHFAHCNAFDIAVILGGDTDLIESIKVVRKGIGKIVILVAYYDENPMKSCTSPSLIEEADYFFNLKDLEETEIEKISDIRIPKQTTDSTAH